MKRIVGGVAFSLLVAVVWTAQAGDLKTIVGLRNFLWVNMEICTAGQPTAGHLRQLKQQGVKAVLNLRRPSEHDAEAEAALVRRLGLRYFNLPVDRADLRDADVEGFLRITGDANNRPMFIHCGSANRVGGFWMIRRVIVDGWPVERAEEEARRIGLRSPDLVEFAKDYIRRYREKEKQKQQEQE